MIQQQLADPTELESAHTAEPAGHDQHAETRIRIEIPANPVDVPFPGYITIGDCISVLVPYLIDELRKAGKKTDWLADPSARWNLKRPFATHNLDPEASLDEEGVRDGESLILVKDDPGEKNTPIIDDTAEFIRYFFEKNLRLWKNHDAQRLALVFLPVVTALICLASVVWTSKTNADLIARIAATSAMVTVATIVATIAAVINHTRRSRFEHAVFPFLLMAYTLYGTALLVILNRPLGVHQLVIAGGLLPIAIILNLITGSNVRLHSAVGTGAVTVLIVASFNLLYHSPTAVIGVQQILVTLCAVLVTARIALAFARIPVPRVPATGEEFGSDESGDLDVGNLPRDESSGVAASMGNQEAQSMATYDLMVGMLCGLLPVIVATAFVVGYNLVDKHQWLIFSFIIAISLMLAYRGKTIEYALLQTILLTASALTLVLFAAGLLLSADPSNAGRAGIILLILALATLISSLFALQARQINSPIVIKMFEIFEVILFVTAIPYLALVMDFWDLTANR
ncbi:type VII secretion integral membrane protein EccD [Mycobacteroides chelonae]|uniref:Type VII secretion integral membrane protein EccD n=1 Tax=Mycobacteroides chelonae TaxID=1774 RepID=A0A1S1LKU0_MYCCH|nr:type VII secretion integral membrane protein EccD [Mycobacteroides chelonae]OHU47214.1 type VII secretion integral membrane protein EccD [Mycobacteroides chelonae]